MSGASSTEPYKKAARGRRGVAVSHNVEASAIGARVLEEGGTAIDAAIAMSFACATRETAMNGIGGAGVLLAHSAATGEVTEVNFYGRTPAALPEDVFVEHLLPPTAERMEFGWCGTEGNVSQRGPLSVGVPAYVSGLGVAHERLASRPWAELVAPAAALARDGFALDEEDLVFLAAYADEIGRYETTRSIYLPSGVGKAAMSELRQPELAATLGALAEAGPGLFRSGDLPERIASHVESLGGYLRASDFARYEPEVGGGLRGRYRGFEVVSASGAMGGVTLLEMLNLAEEVDLAALGHNSGPYLHLLTEIVRQAWVDRFAYLGDPDAGASPIAGMVDKGYAREVAATLPFDRAATRGRPGAPWSYAGMAAPGAGAGARSAPGDGGGSHTTALAAADADGNVATFTQTIGQCYGSCVCAPGTGVVLYDMTYWLNPAPGTPNSVGPWKRPAGHATPVMLLRDGRPVAALGAPGGRKIVTAMLQVILNVVDFGMDVQAAIAAPRIHLEGADPVDPSGAAIATVDVDARMPEASIADLASRGHAPNVVRDSATRIRFARPVGVELRADELLGGVDVHGKSLGIGV